MAKRTREVDLSLLTDADRNSARKFKESSKAIQVQVKQFEEILRKHFCFDEKDIVDYMLWNVLRSA